MSRKKREHERERLAVSLLGNVNIDLDELDGVLSGFESKLSRLEKRLEALEERVSKLERRLGDPT